jgi:hypothetical protein
MKSYFDNNFYRSLLTPQQLFYDVLVYRSVYNLAFNTNNMADNSVLIWILLYTFAFYVVLA